MTKEIKVGDWIESENYGESVCLGITENLVQLRYEAIRKSDQKTIWVQNSDSIGKVKFLRDKDSLSEYVLTLTGPYGESDTGPKKNTYEDFLEKFALSNEEVMELTQTYLSGNNKNVKDLLSNVYFYIYEEAYRKNVDKEVNDYELNNCYLSDAEIRDMTKEYMTENLTENDLYAFVSVSLIRISNKESNKINDKKVKGKFGR